MIHGLHLVNFANHRNTKLFFPRLTALVGENGAGKSNTLRALQEVSRLAENNTLIDEPFSQGVPTLIRRELCRVGSETMTIGLSGKPNLLGKPGQWGLLATASPKQIASKAGVDLQANWFWRNSPQLEGCSDWIPDTKLSEIPSLAEGKRLFRAIRDQIVDQEKERGDSPIETRTLSVIPDEAVTALSSTQYFKAASERLGRPSYPEQLPPRLQSNGDNLASTIAQMMTADRHRFDALLRSLRAIVPSVRNIRSDRTEITRMRQRTVSVNKKDLSYDEEQTVHGDQLYFDMASGSGIRAENVSEGTLLTLGLLTLLHSDPAPRLVLLDDVERGLHPRAQRELMKQLRAVLDLRPELQIVLSSHSPYIIDQLAPEEVWLLAPADDGCAVARRLSDHPNASKALEVLSTGEFWSAEGEGWIVEEAKKPAA